MRTLILVATAIGFLPFCSCSTEDPDLNPQPVAPPSSSNQKAWNQPLPGQGAGALGMMPNQPRR
ncbi:hypothetical protein ACFQY0_04315 [Haloferula chungangensis]|uniref:Lipoprotein n=1 Tax=Haloferula chungangensis TaxID=1048331 RepID=A0ABW2L4H7_9BACT